METISIWDAEHPDYDARIREKQKKLIKIYRDYAAYCASVCEECEIEGNLNRAYWFDKEASEYMLLADQLEASLWKPA